MRNILTLARISKLKEPGLFSDGDGLYLHVVKSGAASWRFIYRRGAKRTELGLGSHNGGFAPVSLSAARVKADAIRRAIVEGGDPLGEARAKRATVAATGVTFGEVADEYISVKQADWTNAVHARQWVQTLAVHAAPLRDLAVSRIDVHAVASCLEPIWGMIPETAQRTRMRVEKVLDYASVKGLRSGENPARLRGIWSIF
jgi:Arm DNA-binding domain